MNQGNLLEILGCDQENQSSEYALLVRELYNYTVEVLESSENALEWLKTPSSTFRNERPADRLSTVAGIQEILDELGRLQHRVFA